MKQRPEGLPPLVVFDDGDLRVVDMGKSLPHAVIEIRAHDSLGVETWVKCTGAGMELAVHELARLVRNLKKAGCDG